MKGFIGLSLVYEGSSSPSEQGQEQLVRPYMGPLPFIHKEFGYFLKKRGVNGGQPICQLGECVTLCGYMELLQAGSHENKHI